MTLAFAYHIGSQACTCTIAVNIPQLQHLIPDPLRYSHWHLVPLKPDVFAGDQGSVLVTTGS